MKNLNQFNENVKEADTKTNSKQIVIREILVFQNPLNEIKKSLSGKTFE